MTVARLPDAVAWRSTKDAKPGIYREVVGSYGAYNRVVRTDGDRWFAEGAQTDCPLYWIELPAAPAAPAAPSNLRLIAGHDLGVK